MNPPGIPYGQDAPTDASVQAEGTEHLTRNGWESLDTEPGAELTARPAPDDAMDLTGLRIDPDSTERFAD
jgi:hypothetical protein